MTSKKIVALFEKLLERTKTGDIEWDRYIPSKGDDRWISITKSFSCKAGSMDIDMLSDDDRENIRFLIDYDDDVPCVSLEPMNSEERSAALRLSNYVYSLFPNFESAVDDFLNSF